MIAFVSAGVPVLPQVQPQDRVPQAVWEAAEAPGGHRQAAGPRGQRESQQAGDTAVQPGHQAGAARLRNPDGTLAGEVTTGREFSLVGKRRRISISLD